MRDKGALRALEDRIRKILPEEYQDSYEEVQPVSMGSAALKYAEDGKVAWDEIWGTFCDLAMAGGPPHKGSLLEPASLQEIEAQPDRYGQVVEEICRGVGMVANLEAYPSPFPGWVRLDCVTQSMAEWLVRAIVMENISARWEHSMIDLPAGPDYRTEKEIKNVITTIAKTCHYWFEHMWLGQHIEIGNLFSRMAVELPLIQPSTLGYDFEIDRHRTLCGNLAEKIQRSTGLSPSNHEYPGWLGVECPSARSAIWMMRALVVSNILSRREGAVLFVPVNPTSDPTGEIVTRSLVRIHGFAMERSVL